VAKDTSCDGYEKDIRSVPVAHFARAGLVRPSEMPIEVRGMVEKLHVGQMSDQFVVDQTHRFFVVCNRSEPVNGLPSREEIRRRIENERLELLAARYLRDLRRAAFVEIRI
jgi:peptidyl-prolyl cis-trans isomerase SurA